MINKSNQSKKEQNKRGEMKNMEDLFSNLEEDTMETNPVEKVGEDNKQEVTMEDMVSNLERAVKEDSSLKDRLGKNTKDLEVVHSLGFGDSGNIVVDKEASEKSGERKLKETSRIVGYRIKNIGKQNLEYPTEVWTTDKEGNITSKKVNKTLKPNETADLTREYMTIFTSKPEISFALNNGKIVKGAGARTAETIREELESYYFRFNRDKDGNLKQINDDSVKINIAEKNKNGQWEVKKEFKETFGFLDEQSSVDNSDGNKRATNKKEGYDRQEITANYINNLIKEEGHHNI